MCAETKNDLEGEDAYANINVLQPLGQLVMYICQICGMLTRSRVLMPYLRTLRKEIRPSKTNDGDGKAILPS